MIQFIGPLNPHSSTKILSAAFRTVSSRKAASRRGTIFSAGPLIRGIPQDHLVNHLRSSIVINANPS